MKVNKRPDIWNELDKQNPREAYKLSLLDMFRFWDSLNVVLKSNYLVGHGLDKVIWGKYRGRECLMYKGMPVILSDKVLHKYRVSMPKRLRGILEDENEE